jgi:hypothetical protein
VEFDPMDDFERELKEAMERRPAPPSLKGKILDRRRRQNTLRMKARVAMWQKLAASIVLAALVGGAVAWHNAQERRKSEEVRQQVLTALRITNRALDHMNEQLADHGRDTQ